MNAKQRRLFEKIKTLTAAETAKLDLAVSAKLRRGSENAKSLSAWSTAVIFGREWWGDPFMKTAYVLVFIGVVSGLVITPRAPAIAGPLGPLWGTATYVLLMTLPMLIAISGLRIAFQSVDYRLEKYLVTRGSRSRV